MSNNNGNVSVNNRTIASCFLNGSTHIPLPKTYTSNIKLTNGLNSPERWKSKLEESEKKRKALLTQSEKTMRELEILNRKYDRLCEQNKKIVHQLNTKHDEFEKLKIVSAGLYKEYDTLKNKYELETGAMHEAMQQATKWYKENNKLKRKSAVLVQRMMTINPEELLEDVVDNPEESSSDSETENLRESIKELSNTVARLQADLNSAKLMEFEATEQTINLNQELEQERGKRIQLEKELQELRGANEHMARVSKLVANEVANLRDEAQRDRDKAVTLRNEADVARRERNVLAHQSALLLGEITSDGDDKVIILLQEIENLKRDLEEQQNQHMREIAELQEKLEDHESKAQIEILEEKLNLVECELQEANERAEKAENEIKALKAAPPPPPPPPPLMLTSTNNVPKVKLKTSNFQNITAVQDMEQILGIENSNGSTKKIVPSGVIDDVISQIKGGRFTLKATDKIEHKKPREEPEAVKEMLSVLGTLRRRQRPARKLTDSPFGDVQL